MRVCESIVLQCQQEVLRDQYRPLWCMGHGVRASWLVLHTAKPNEINEANGLTNLHTCAILFSKLLRRSSTYTSMQCNSVAMATAARCYLR
jgi:hypothetical protein